MKTLPMWAFYEPEQVGVARISAEMLIAVRRGSDGYIITASAMTADELNRMHGVTPEDARAMLAGSMWGWHVPAARVTQ